ncbi:MAG: DUF4136 domain-containing protein [Bacteroidales bacterium]|jgi:hypothetical protein|nr:DUF4136 domain-containing protein [Bacteroidales bacterium]
MKRFLLSTLLLFTVFGCLASQTAEQTCHFGITFEISKNPNWGYGEPIILAVEPNSPAEVAGIKPGDIIMEINGAATYLRDYQTIASLLFDTSSDLATFTVRNLNNYFREYELPRQCRPINSIGESELASSFSFYSLENTQERAFVLPLQITTNEKIDYSDYHTYGFMDAPADASPLDKRINAEIETVLNEKGLKHSLENPDILIQTYYSYQPNANYRPQTKTTGAQGSWRYDVAKKEMVFVPILSGDDMKADNNGQFILELGIRFYEKKYVNPDVSTLIWEASVREFMTAHFPLEEYAPFHLPLIMMQFPYSSNKTTARYVVDKKSYYYTGLFYNANDLKTVTAVDRNSPAYRAGIRQNMVIGKINGDKFVYTKAELTNGYKRFLNDTMGFRDSATLFTDANGFPDCMYWKPSEYDNIEKAFGKSIYAPLFKYLYGFEEYIYGKSTSKLVIEANGKRYDVVPEKRSSLNIRAY